MPDLGSEPERVLRPLTVANLLFDPAVSCALKHVLLIWAVRDPVDAARDARLLADVLERRADEAVSCAR